MVSPIVEIFPYAENLDREIERKPMVSKFEEEESAPAPKGKVFSAPGSDLDDEEIAEDEDSELEDEYTDEE
jgi:hypothetical protein